jgi:hypothetical protein
MHPYFAQELVRERQNELLRRQQFRHRDRTVEPPRPPKASLFARARRSLGRALVALGTRLLGGAPANNPAAIELSTTRR